MFVYNYIKDYDAYSRFNGALSSINKIENRIKSVENLIFSHIRFIAVCTAGYAFSKTIHNSIKNYNKHPEVFKNPFNARNLLSNSIANFGSYIKPLVLFASFIQILKGLTSQIDNSIDMIDLTYEAKRGRLQPLSGREKELGQLIHILSVKNLGNPLLTGHAGCGKTALVEGLAARIQQKEVPKALQNAKIYVLSIEQLFAGGRWQGDTQERIQLLLNRLERETNAILFIDEVHRIMENRNAGPSNMNISEKLKPVMTSGKIKIIGATTVNEFREIERDPAMTSRFTRVNLEDPTKKEAIQILQNVKEKRFEKPYHVSIDNEVIAFALEKLNHKPGYIREAFKLLELVCAKAQLKDKPKVTREMVKSVLQEFPMFAGKNTTTSSHLSMYV